MDYTKDNNELDIIIEGGTLLTMSDTMDVIDNPLIGIRDGKIAFITRGDIHGANSYTAKKVISAHGSLIMPGLINTHTHLPMVCFRGLADDLPPWSGSITKYFQRSTNSCRGKWFMQAPCLPLQK